MVYTSTRFRYFRKEAIFITFTTPSSRHILALKEFKASFGNHPTHGACGLSSSDQVEEWIITKAWEKSNSICRILYDNSTDTVLAICRLNATITRELVHNCGYNFAYSVHSKYRRKGYGYAIMCDCMNLGKQLGMNVFLMAASIDNVASWRCMEKAGAKRAGRIKDDYVYYKFL